MKTPGQEAYERDVAYQPTYHDGTQRPRWEDLQEVVQWTWEKNPTNRCTLTEKDTP